MNFFVLQLPSLHLKPSTSLIFSPLRTTRSQISKEQGIYQSSNHNSHPSSKNRLHLPDLEMKD